MARKVKQYVVGRTSSTLILPGSDELPWLAIEDEDEEAVRFNAEFTAWWDRVRVALQYGLEDSIITPIQDRVVDVHGIAPTDPTDPVVDTASCCDVELDGGGMHIHLNRGRMDGGGTGPMIMAWDGGSPDSEYDFVLRSESSGVDEALVTPLITGTQSGGTP